MAGSNKTVHARLSEVQVQLKAPKGQFNKFGGYSYRNAEDILEAVKPLLSQHGLMLTLTDSIELIGDWHYVKATAAVTCIETGDVAFTEAYAREEPTKKGMDSSQITGAASSYARKYAMNGLFNIDDTRDADSDKPREPKSPQPAKTASAPATAPPSGSGATPKQLKYIATLFTQQGISEREARHARIEEILEHEVGSATQLTKAEAKKVIDNLMPEGGE